MSHPDVEFTYQQITRQRYEYREAVITQAIRFGWTRVYFWEDWSDAVKGQLVFHCDDKLPIGKQCDCIELAPEGVAKWRAIEGGGHK